MRRLLSRCITPAVLVCGLALMVSWAPAAPARPSGTESRVVELRIDGEIEPILAEYITDSMDQAAKEHARLILITMNTPGGLDTAMRAIIQKILASKVPVAVYVTPSGARGASAGFYILLSADIAAMSPATNTGAASPIFVSIFTGSPVNIDETLHKKFINDALAFLRGYGVKRGRNVDLAVTAVTDAKAFTEKEALEGKLIDVVATSREDLLAKLDGRTITRLDGTAEKLDLAGAVIEVREMSGRQKFLSRIVEPDMMFILLIVGVLGLYAEFTHPGMVAPGVIGGIAMILALYAMQLLPVNFAGLLLIALALAMFIVEAKFPSHGVLGVGGVVAMVLGALMLVRSPLTGMGVHLATALGVALPFALIIIFLMRLVLRSFSWKQSAGTGKLLGAVGEVTIPIEAAGKNGMVLVQGELWRAVSPLRIPQGVRVRVKKVSGLTLTVEPEEAPPAASRG